VYVHGVLVFIDGYGRDAVACPLFIPKDAAPIKRTQPTVSAMNIESPIRVRHTCSQSLQASADRVFPLLCPVREAEWIPGWMPKRVISESGVAEPDAIFETNVEGHVATWLITRHDPAARLVDMVQFIPDLVMIQLWIAVNHVTGDSCTCDVTYQYTALSPDGERFVRERDAIWYRDTFMREWETLMNAFLG